MFTNLNLTDMETGYKAFRAEVLRQIQLRSRRFTFEPEVTAKIARLGVRIYEVPISYSGRTYAEGKKIHWKDGVSALGAILRYNLFDDTADAGGKTLRWVSTSPATTPGCGSRLPRSWDSECSRPAPASAL